MDDMNLCASVMLSAWKRIDRAPMRNAGNQARNSQIAVLDNPIMEHCMA
jgi:hypothetical protein